MRGVPGSNKVCLNPVVSLSRPSCPHVGYVITGTDHQAAACVSSLFVASPLSLPHQVVSAAAAAAAGGAGPAG